MDMMADWSTLPCDILSTIALILEQLDELICFSAVCHSWYQACSAVKSLRNPNVVTPWLLLAENTNDNPDCLRKVYNLSNDKSYRLKMPQTFGTRCWGSSYGWIALQTFDYEVHLFNPLTNVRITSLPSILTLLNQPKPYVPPDYVEEEPDDPLEVQQLDFYSFFIKVVVLKMHDDGNSKGDSGNLLIAAMYGEFEYLAFARLGDQSWTYTGEWWVKDVVCCGDRIYIARWDGQLKYCDIKGCLDLKDVKVVEYVPAFKSEVWAYDKVYIVDLCGDLVMVLRSKEDLDPGYLTRCFVVYRLDKKNKKWVEIMDIGNFSIFVGHHSSMACSILVANKCISNSIYFTDDETFEWRRVPGFGGHDMGVCDIRSAYKINQFYHEDDDTCSSFCPPIFFLPTCCLTD